MKLIYPYIEILENNENIQNYLKNIEKYGRVCYKSEEKINENSYKKFISNIIKNQHESVLEHEKITIRIVCDRALSMELIRHRLCSFSQESTRYCKYNDNITYIIPHWIINISEGIYNVQNFSKILNNPHISISEKAWFTSCLECETKYKTLLLSHTKPQDARNVLNHSLKTELIMTANLREWRHILQLRTSRSAHPDMVKIMKFFLQDIKNKMPIIFDDIL